MTRSRLIVMLLAAWCLAGVGCGNDANDATKATQTQTSGGPTYRGHTADYWTRALADRDPEYRAQATAALAALGSDAADAAPALIEALKDEHAPVRAGAAAALGDIGSAANAEAALQAASKDSDATVRMNAIVALGQMTGSPAAGPLVDALDDDNEQVRRVAVSLLVKMGQPAVAEVSRLVGQSDYAKRLLGLQILGQIKHADAIPALTAALADERQQIRDTAIVAFSAIGAPAVAALDKLIDDQDRQTRWSAAYALSIIGGSKSVAPLVKGLDDADSGVRDLAARALVKIGDPAINPLAAATKHQNATVRLGAVTALGGMAKPAVIPYLEAALADADPRVRELAVMALGATGSEDAIPALKRALSSEDSQVRTEAMLALSRLGKDAVDILAGGLKSKNWQVRRAACDGLGMLGVIEAVPHLRSALEMDEDARVRTAAAIGIGRIGPNALTAVSPLIRAFKDKAESVRNAAAAALAHVAPGADTAVPALIKTLKDDDPHARAGAATAIAYIGQSARAAVYTLIQTMADKDPAVIEAARLALVKIGPEAAAGLVRALTDPDNAVRIQVIETLGYLRQDAAAAVPTLVVLLKSQDPKVREAVVFALGLIGNEARIALNKASKGEDAVLAAAAAKALATIIKQKPTRKLPKLPDEDQTPTPESDADSTAPTTNLLPN